MSKEESKDIGSLSIEESKVFKGILGQEITKAITELQLLEDIMAQDDFILKSPPNYTLYQRLLLSYFMQMIHGIGAAEEAQQSNDDGSGDSEVQT